MAGDSIDSFPKLESVYRVPGSKFNELNQNVAKAKLISEQTVDSGVNSRQLQNRSGVIAPSPWFSQNSSLNAWGNPNLIHKLTKRGNSESGVAKCNNLLDKNNSSKNLNCIENAVLNNKSPPQTVICPTPEKGLYSSVVDVIASEDHKNDERCPHPHDTIDCENNEDEIIGSESNIVFDSDDDLSLADLDSDIDQKSHEALKKSKWFRDFFDDLDKLTVEQISSQERQWHCPACQGGSGAIDWYQGLQPLLHHARTILARRARLHRLLAETLEDEFIRRRALLTVATEAYGRWEGLDKQVKDHEIVWPPMVVIMNTQYELDQNDKWNGMGNQELLDCFSNYAALKARHSYGPQGHRGMSVLIFEGSTAGYLEALRLHKHFKEQKRDRDAWNCRPKPFGPGGKRQLYGYLALREDLDIFNRHARGKSKVKFEIRSYQEMVESKIKHINEDSQRLHYFENKIAKEQIKSQALADSLCKLSEKLRQTTEENHVVRECTKLQHEQNKVENQIQIIKQAIGAKEGNFEKLQQEKREKMKQSYSIGVSVEKWDDKHGVQNICSSVVLHDKEMGQFEAERDNLIKINEEKKLALKKKQWQEQVDLEKEFENELTQLMDKYTSGQS